MKVYLDNAATSKPYEEVAELMNDIQLNRYGNPSSSHSMGLEAEKLLKNAGDIIGKTMNTSRENLVFTSGGTESDNMALMQPFWNVNRIKGRRIIASSIEHPAVENVCEYLVDCGAELIHIPVDGYGTIDLDFLEKSIQRDTAIVSVMYVNNEVGTIQPIKDICSIKTTAVSEKNADLLLHTDAVQAYGKLSIDLDSDAFDGIDLLSISGHKIHGPKGAGVLYMKSPTKVRPLLKGGGQQGGYRSGTENVSGIAGFGCAAEIQYTNREDNMRKIAGLRKLLLDGLMESIGDIRINSPVDISLTGQPGKCIPTILSVSFLGAKGEVILHSLEQDGIFVSTESACSSKKKSNSTVLTAMGKNAEEIEGTLRFSLSASNTKEEILYTIQKTKIAVEKFRKLTGYKRK